MPITRSAKKAARQSVAREIRNTPVKNELKILAKKIKKSLAAKNEQEVSDLLSIFFSKVDKAVKKGIFKLNKAARMKSSYASAAKKEFGKDLGLAKRAVKGAPSSAKPAKTPE